MTLDNQDFLNIVLNGNPSGSIALPKRVAEDFICQNLDHKDWCHLDDQGQYYELWSKEGWENELKRREYIASIGVHNPKLPSVVKVESETEIRKQIVEALKVGDMARVIELQLKLSKKPI